MTEKTSFPADHILAAARLADEQKATDIVVLDMRKVCSFTDGFLIATCDSTPQMRGLAQRIERNLREEGPRPLGTSGYDSTAWLVLDYGDFLVHLFSREARMYYKLDNLWKDAPRVEWTPAPPKATDKEIPDHTAT